MIFAKQRVHASPRVAATAVGRVEELLLLGCVPVSVETLGEPRHCQL